MSIDPPNNLLAKLKSSKGDILIPRVELGEKGKCAHQFIKGKITSSYVSNLQLSDIVASLVASPTFNTDLACRAILQIIPDLQFKSSIKISNVEITKESLALKAHLIDLSTVLDLNCGTETIITHSIQTLSEEDKLVVLGYCLLPVRLSSYREEGISLRQEVRQRLQNLLIQICHKPHILIDKLKAPDHYYMAGFNNTSLLHLASIIDLSILTNSDSFISPLRVVTITTFHMDNSVLLKFLQILSKETLDIEFLIRSIILEPVGKDMEILLDPIHDIFKQRNLVAYMKGLGLVQKSLFSTVELPFLHIFLSTLIALFFDARLFKSVLVRPETECSIILAYLIFQEHTNILMVQDFFVQQHDKLPVKRTFKEVENKEEKINRIKSRCLSKIGLTSKELNDLKIRSRNFSDRPRSIAAHIALMLPVDDLDETTIEERSSSPRLKGIDEYLH